MSQAVASVASGAPFRRPIQALRAGAKSFTFKPEVMLCPCRPLSRPGPAHDQSFAPRFAYSASLRRSEFPPLYTERKKSADDWLRSDSFGRESARIDRLAGPAGSGKLRPEPSKRWRTCRVLLPYGASTTSHGAGRPADDWRATSDENEYYIYPIAL